MSVATQTESGHPRAWRWDDDGLAVEGSFVRMDEAPSEYGVRGIVVLDVDGEERSVWLAQEALRRKFADELKRRKAGDFEPGERIAITRGAAKKESASGRSYWPFVATFADAPRRSAADILGVEPSSDSVEESASSGGGVASHDGIPFQPTEW